MYSLSAAHASSVALTGARHACGVPQQKTSFQWHGAWAHGSPPLAGRSPALSFAAGPRAARAGPRRAHTRCRGAHAHAPPPPQWRPWAGPRTPPLRSSSDCRILLMTIGAWATMSRVKPASDVSGTATRPCTLRERCDALHVPDEPAGLDHDGVVCAAHSLRDLRTWHVHHLLHALPNYARQAMG